MAATILQLSAREPADRQLPTATEMLPFIKEGRSGKRNYWSVPSTGDFNHDAQLGRYYGERAVAAMFRDQESPGGVFGLVALDMIRAYGGKAIPEGLIIGFMSAVAMHLTQQPRMRLPTAIDG